MKEHKLVVQGETLGSPWLSSRGAVGSASFYVAGLDNPTLHFSIGTDDDGAITVTPCNITYCITINNTGEKIALEVAENGFIVKSSGKTQVASSEYDMEQIIKGIIKRVDNYDVPFHADEYDFNNLDSIIQTLTELVADKQAG